MDLTAAELLERQGAERLLRVIRGADPGAGAEVDITVPGGGIWLLQSMVVTNVTDATAASRNVNLAIDDGTLEFCRVGPGQSQPASTTIVHSWIRGQGIASAAGGYRVIQSGAPAIPLLPGFHIRTVTTNLAAGDNFGAPVFYVEEISERGQASQLAYEVARLIRENAQLDAIERGGF